MEHAITKTEGQEGREITIPGISGEFSIPSPTQREIEVVRMLSNGMVRKEIAVATGKSVRTIEALIDKTRTKYQASTVPALVAFFLRKEFIK